MPVDRGLVVRAQAGDREAFTALVSAAFETMRRTAWLILRDAGAVDEAVQEALLGAWQDLPRLREPVRFEAWLRRLLVRACADQARRARAFRLREVPILGRDGSIAPDTQGQVAARDELERGLRRLTVEQRTVLVLTYYLDLPIAEAAAALDIPAGTMKSRLDRARQALRAELEAQERGVAAGKERFA